MDDVWHVEDAEPIVKAFRNCKIVLTTRMNDIEQYIPTKHVVCVGPMEQSEAISLLTSGVIDISQLSKENVNLLDELAQDVHLWPLLLSLIRGQLSHNLRRHCPSYHEAIDVVQRRLYDKGLTGFDKNSIESNRKYAAKLCIEVSLGLLTKSLSNSIKKLILWTGIGTSIPSSALHKLWNVSKYEVTNIADALWAYGLVQLTDIKNPSFKTIKFVEVHAVISQFMIIESFDIGDIKHLSPRSMGNDEEIVGGLNETFLEHVNKSSNTLEWLNIRLSANENFILPYYFQQISSFIVTDILRTKFLLSPFLEVSQNIATFLPQIYQEILKCECTKLLKNTYSLSRKLNQKIQRCLVQRDYLNLIQALKMYIGKYPTGLIAQQAVASLEKAKPYCKGKLLSTIIMACEMLHMMTPDCHNIKLWILPIIELITKEHQKIEKSLQSGPHDREAVLQYYLSGKHAEEMQLINLNSIIKAQQIAPNVIKMQAELEGFY